MTEPIEFLPCPFCGSSIVGALTEATVRDPVTGKQVPDTRATLGVVGCGACGCEGPSLWDTPEEMAAAWNRRAKQGGLTMQLLDPDEEILRELDNG